MFGRSEDLHLFSKNKLSKRLRGSIVLIFISIFILVIGLILEGNKSKFGFLIAGLGIFLLLVSFGNALIFFFYLRRKRNREQNP
jgi:uncharacterized membrane protein HdeD (DUF308 family)